MKAASKWRIMGPIVECRCFVDIPPYQLIETEAQWQACLEVLQRQPRLAVDIEANSLFAYKEQICLFQVSAPGVDYIIDPLAGFSLDALARILADPAIEKVFHASGYDLMLLRTLYGWKVNNLFDTMWAGRILGFRNMGLAWFLQEFYGVELSKRYQKANWAQRPLSEAQLAYAQKDTYYLLRLRDDLAAKLEERGFLEEAKEIFENESRIQLPKQKSKQEAFWNVRGARDLRPQTLAILKALFAFRDRAARERNWPPFKIISDEKLVLLAKHAPRNNEELAALNGLSPRQLDHLGPGLLKAIAEGRRMRPPTPPQRELRHAQEASSTYKRLFEWRKEMAARREVESDVIMTRETMWEIAELAPKRIEDFEKISTLGPFRRALYAEEILQRLAE